MKYSVLGFDQKALVKYKLDLVDTMVLRYFVDFRNTDCMTMIIHENEPYYWLRYEALIEALPILDISNKKVLRRRLIKLVDAGILKHYTLKIGGTFSYYAIGNEYKNLVMEGGTEKYQGSNSKVQEGGTEEYHGWYSKVQTNNSSIKDTSIKDNNIYKRIIDYLNKKVNAHYRPSTGSTKRVIDARLNEGFSEDDFYKVIDIKVKDWLGTDFATYLRPETLFGAKFDSYLNQKKAIKKSKGDFNNYEQRTYDYESLERKLLGLDGVDEC